MKKLAAFILPAWNTADEEGRKLIDTSKVALVLGAESAETDKLSASKVYLGTREVVVASTEEGWEPPADKIVLYPG